MVVVDMTKPTSCEGCECRRGDFLAYDDKEFLKCRLVKNGDVWIQAPRHEGGISPQCPVKAELPDRFGELIEKDKVLGLPCVGELYEYVGYAIDDLPVVLGDSLGLQVNSL